MPRTTKPRKKHTIKGVNIPITKGLVDDLGKEMHFGLMALKNGGASALNWKRVGKVLFILSMATDGAGIDRADKVAIDSAVLTLKAISDFEVSTGVWKVSDIDMSSLMRGATAAERVIPRMDYRRLVAGYSTFIELTRSIN